VIGWLKKGEFNDNIYDFINVASAYICMYDAGNVPENLLKRFESVIRKQALNIDANQAI